MRTLLSISLLFAPALFAADAQSIVHIDSAKTAAAFAKGGLLLDAGAYKIMGAHRETSGEGELHTEDTDIFYVLRGEATFVTGGKLLQPHSTGAGELRGPSVEGGDERHLAKGDIIVIPNNTPHWFKAVPGPFDYYVVKVRTSTTPK